MAVIAVSLPFNTELTIATEDEKVLIPILVDPDYAGTPPGGLFECIRISDVSTPAKWTVELPQLIETIRAILPGKLYQELIQNG